MVMIVCRSSIARFLIRMSMSNLLVVRCLVRMQVGALIKKQESHHGNNQQRS